MSSKNSGLSPLGALAIGMGGMGAVALGAYVMNGWIKGDLNYKIEKAVQAAMREQLTSLKGEAKDQIIHALLTPQFARQPSALQMSSLSRLPTLHQTQSAPPIVDSSDEKSGHNKKVYKLVLTGGPCAGKSTALARVKGFLQSRGYFVATVAEAANFLHQNGVTYYPKEPLMFQRAVTSIQRDHEERIFKYCEEIAMHKDCTVFIYKIYDGRSYCDEEAWMTVLRDVGLPLSEEALRSRYDAIFHLVTAADGAEKYYTKMSDGKMVRHEEPAQAVALDKNLQSAWAGHPKHFILKNTGTFDDKINNLVSGICSVLGIVATKRKAAKFLLLSLPKSFPASGLHNMSTSIFTKTYVRMPDNQGKDSVVMFVRERYQTNFRVTEDKKDLEIRSYILKTIRTEDNQNIEEIRTLSLREYKGYLSFADSDRVVVRQKRVQFTFDDKFYEIVEYLKPVKTPRLLLLNVHQSQEDVEPMKAKDVPDFIPVEREVTKEREYSAHYLSMKLTKK
ncbi:hypothetical protein AAMO2058_001204400 [Amorphochlora amoebiformis]